MIEIPRPTDTMHPDLQETLLEAAAVHEEFSARGYTEARVKEKVGLGRRLALLAARGIDISEATTSREQPAEREMTPEEEAKYDYLDNIGSMSADEIKHRIKE
jgi:hypothetical protein